MTTDMGEKLVSGEVSDATVGTNPLNPAAATDVESASAASILDSFVDDDSVSGVRVERRMIGARETVHVLPCSSPGPTPARSADRLIDRGYHRSTSGVPLTHPHNPHATQETRLFDRPLFKAAVVYVGFVMLGTLVFGLSIPLSFLDAMYGCLAKSCIFVLWAYTHIHE